MDMNTRVAVVPSDKLIVVGTSFLKFDFTVIPGHEHLHALQWVNGSGHLEFDDDYNQPISGEQIYKEEVQPYVDLWQAETDRLAAKKAAEEAIYNNLENTLSRALTKLDQDLEKAKTSKTAHLTSSVGFVINANETASTNIDGLIKLLTASGQSTVAFMAFDNTAHEVTLDQLKTMQIEVLSRGPALYQKKWAIRSKLEACTTSDCINAITWDEDLNLTSTTEA